MKKMQIKSAAGLLLIFGTIGVNLFFTVPPYLLVPLILIGLLLSVSYVHDVWKKRNTKP
tara:strand:+ start:1192 stop:1368 length:177 start_codon:yes stop_codon:yes gene_type:complete